EFCCVVISHEVGGFTAAIAQTKRVTQTTNPAEAEVGLTAHAQLTGGAAGQANGGFTTEQTASQVVAVINSNCAFQRENGFQAVAEVFNTPDAAAGLRCVAAVDTGGARLAVKFVVVQASINDTVQRNGGLGVCGTSKASKQRGGDKG